MPSRGRRVGVDVGSVRVGVAESDPDGILASPVTTLARDESDERADLAELATLVRDRDATCVYVGLPLHLSGVSGEAARLAREYAAQLAALVAPVRVRLVDERLTSVASHRLLHESGRAERTHRAVVDQVAAVLILQAALEAERATGLQPGELVSTSGRKPRTKGRA
ncbi:MAG TPA: Holliday junction resolvase RuvX [Phycicoccus elongatus]|nr:Holliday junction resolvase RuvX [Phycicoccus elongatus]